MSILGRRVKMFRCVRDAMIGPKPRQAYMPEDYGWTATMVEGNCIHVITDKPVGNPREFIVPIGNLENIEIFPKERPADIRQEPLDHHGDEVVKRRPGRPPSISGAV